MLQIIIQCFGISCSECNVICRRCRCRPGAIVVYFDTQMTEKYSTAICHCCPTRCFLLSLTKQQLEHLPLQGKKPHQCPYSCRTLAAAKATGPQECHCVQGLPHRIKHEHVSVKPTSDIFRFTEGCQIYQCEINLQVLLFKSFQMQLFMM